MFAKMNRLLLFILTLLAVNGYGANIVCTNLVDSINVNYPATSVKFTPLTKVPQAYGNSSVMPSVVQTGVTNGAFAINIIAGGVYSFQPLPVNSFVPPVNVLVPSNDTNTYTLNQAIGWATNNNNFYWTNSLPFVAGTGIYFTTNGAVIAINSTGGGGSGTSTNVPFLDVTNTTPGWREGRLAYDTNVHTFVAYNDRSNVTYNVGEELFVRGINTSGATISNGAVVTFSSTGGGTIPRLALAQSTTNTEALGYSAIGMATEDIANGSQGMVTISGIVHGVNTDSWPVNTTVWLSTNAGAYTTNPPPSGYERTIIGSVARQNGNNGDIFVNVRQPVHWSDISGTNNFATVAALTTVSNRAELSITNHQTGLIDIVGVIFGSEGESSSISLGQIKDPDLNLIWSTNAGFAGNGNLITNINGENIRLGTLIISGVGSGSQNKLILTNEVIKVYNYNSDQTGTIGYDGAWRLSDMIIADGSGITSLNASSLSSGIIPMGRITASGTNLAGSFLTTDGAGNRGYTNNAASLTNLNASELRSGTVSLALLPSAVITNGQTGTVNVTSATGTNSITAGGMTIADSATNTITSATIAINDATTLTNTARYPIWIGTNAPGVGTASFSIRSNAAIFTGIANFGGGNTTIAANGSINMAASFIQSSGNASFGGFIQAPTASEIRWASRAIMRSLNTNAWGVWATNGTPLIEATNGAVRVQALQFVAGTTITNIVTATATIDFPSISGQSSYLTNITAAGVNPNDSVILGLPTSTADGLAFTSFPSNGVVYLRALNITTNAVDPASATYRVTVLEH